MENGRRLKAVCACCLVATIPVVSSSTPFTGIFNLPKQHLEEGLGLVSLLVENILKPFKKMTILLKLCSLVQYCCCMTQKVQV